MSFIRRVNKYKRDFKAIVFLDSPGKTRFVFYPIYMLQQCAIIYYMLYTWTIRLLPAESTSTRTCIMTMQIVVYKVVTGVT